jgi:hypothetical protein
MTWIPISPADSSYYYRYCTDGPKKIYAAVIPVEIASRGWLKLRTAGNTVDSDSEHARN